MINRRSLFKFVAALPFLSTLRLQAKPTQTRVLLHGKALNLDGNLYAFTQEMEALDDGSYVCTAAFPGEAHFVTVEGPLFAEPFVFSLVNAPHTLCSADTLTVTGLDMT